MNGLKILKMSLCVMLMLAAMLAGGIPASLHAQDLVQVVKIVLAEPKLEAGGEQLVQVSLRNTSRKSIRAGVQVEIRAGKKRPTGILKKRVVALPPFAERRVFFPLRAPEASGRYNVRLVVLSPNFRQNLLSGNPEFFAPFVVTGGPPLEPPLDESEGGVASVGRRTNFAPPKGLKFEKPDLIWENFSVDPPQVLIGEPLKVKADLRNVGGDIARDIGVRLEYVNVRLPTRRIPIATSRVEVLAPGEKLELEFEHPFSENTLLGEYRIILIADSEEKVEESNEQNNRRETGDPVRVSTIRQLFPEPEFHFEEAGLFLFRWDSRRYNEFKVQVGTDQTFSNQENFFDIPQGEKWTPDTEVVPLAGELPAMLKGLLLREKKEIAYWRVVGRIAGTDKQGFSLIRPFRLKISEPADEPTPADAAPANDVPRASAPAAPASGAATGGAPRSPASPTPGSAPAAPPPGSAGPAGNPPQ